MTFPSATGTIQDDLAVAWARARQAAASVKLRATSLRALSAAGPVGSSAILDFSTFLEDMKLQLIRSRDTAGIGPYAQAQINDNTINVATEFNAMMAQIDASIAWINTNFPKDGSGFLLAVQFVGSTGRTADRQFSTATLATFRTVLDSLIATID